MEIITTKRLYLRQSTTADAEHTYLLNLDPDVIKYTGDPPFKSIEEARKFLENYEAYYAKYKMGRWYAFLKENDEFIGWCGLKYHSDTGEVDLGYRLLKKHWNKGYTTEASIACIQYGFEELGLNRIIAQADVANAASVKVMKKIGMQFLSDADFDGEPGVVYQVEKGKWKII